MTHEELAAEVDDVARIAARAAEHGGTREDLTESLRTLSARLFELVADAEAAADTARANGLERAA